MANPIPSTLTLEVDSEVLAILLELIPITCPSIFTKGPPEFPGLIAASVWIALILTVSFDSFVLVTCRFKEEMIPEVTEFAYSDPNGEPIAIAGSPTFKALESPKEATVSTLSELIFNTAKSE